MNTHFNTTSTAHFNTTITTHFNTTINAHFNTTIVQLQHDHQHTRGHDHKHARTQADRSSMTDTMFGSDTSLFYSSMILSMVCPLPKFHLCELSTHRPRGNITQRIPFLVRLGTLHTLLLGIHGLDVLLRAFCVDIGVHTAVHRLTGSKSSEN
jgi:hypothetical protein